MKLIASTTPQKVGLVFLHGGVLGAVQPGMVSVLWERGVISDKDHFVIVGSSVGAINASGFCDRLAKGDNNPGRSLERMWKKKIRLPEDIARIPVTFYEFLVIMRHVLSGWQEPETRTVRRFRATEALRRFFARRIWRQFFGNASKTMCTARHSFSRGWQHPREKRVQMGRLRSVFRRLRGEDEVSLMYPFVHPLLFFRRLRKRLYEFFNHIHEAEGLADRSPIDAVIGDIDFVAIERARDWIELVIVTTVEEGDCRRKPRYFSSCEYSPAIMHSAVRASIAYPPWIAPVQIYDVRHGDGGASDVFPVQEALDRGCDVVYVFCTMPKHIESTVGRATEGWFPWARRTIEFPEFRSLNTYEFVREFWRQNEQIHLIEPREILPTVTSTLQFENADDIRGMIRIGREAANNLVDGFG